MRLKLRQSGKGQAWVGSWVCSRAKLRGQACELDAGPFEQDHKGVARHLVNRAGSQMPGSTGAHLLDLEVFDELVEIVSMR